MPQQLSVSVENSFIKGLITEATGLNFPENACTAVDNCIFSTTGEVNRRAGIDYEDNFTFNSDLNRNGVALSTYVWKNASGDGLTQVYVLQIGNVITFYEASAADILHPVSTKRLATSINITNFLPVGSANNPGLTECQYADGNGYLFIFHPQTNPIACTLTGGAVTATAVTIRTRDFLGVPENTVANFRPSGLSIEHQYNLNNQGWTSAATWGCFTPTVTQASLGLHTFTVDAGMPVIIGQQVAASDQYSAYISGTVTAYAGTNLTVNVYASNNPTGFMGLFGPYGIESRNTSLITDFHTALGSYPSNADIWWTFKNTSEVFDPATTAANVTLSLGFAPKGHFVVDTFNQLRDSIASLPGLAAITTVKRPNTGAWFQGRVWYAGVNASVPPSGNAPYYTWTENIYFSQIITSSLEFGLCYQNNDPTSENFADLLPTDGGVIQIQGCGAVHKLFPVQNGLLVFASNGIWFITGSQGIGFTATDYTVTQISGVQTNSGVSFINMQGYPVFWNEEGIYAVTANQQGGLSVENLCLNTIATFYDDIPSVSKRFARGDYNPLTYVISWVFRSTFESDVSTRYEYDRVLNFNTATKTFYPYTVSTVSGAVYPHDIKYITGAGGGTSSPSTFKYLTSANRFQFTFAEENDNTRWIDFFSYNSAGSNYQSTFTTGYKVKPSQAMRRWHPTYVTVFNKPTSAYKIQGIWDYAISGNSGRYSAQQTFFSEDPYVSVQYKRHKIRGHGLSLQLNYESVDGQPFSFIGWSMLESANATV